MSYLCIRPVELRGRKYASGDIIPDGTVINQRARKLMSMGYITSVPDQNAAVIRSEPPERALNETAKELYTSGEKSTPEGRRRARRATKKAEDKEGK